jgi:hypothetical protein
MKQQFFCFCFTFIKQGSKGNWFIHFIPWPLLLEEKGCGVEVLSVNSLLLGAELGSMV